jgi:dolichyl-phosphate beta-glucosyltransferase
MIILTIVIPAYNEEKRLPLFLSSLILFLNAVPDLTYEILVVNDGSFDKTGDVARETIGQRGLVIDLNKNRGKGAAIKEGARHAKGLFTCVTDADGSANLDAFLEGVSVLRYSRCQGVVGTRYLSDQRAHQRMSKKRRFAGIFFASLTRIILGLRYSDTQCGFKIFHTKFLNDILAKCQYTRFGIDFELLYIAKKNGIAFIELPIRWSEKPGSKVNIFSDGFQMILDMIRLKFRGNHQLSFQIQSVDAGFIDFVMTESAQPNAGIYEKRDQQNRYPTAPKKLG